MACAGDLIWGLIVKMAFTVDPTFRLMQLASQRVASCKISGNTFSSGNPDKR
jgi:hypothetical protein